MIEARDGRGSGFGFETKYSLNPLNPKDYNIIGPEYYSSFTQTVDGVILKDFGFSPDFTDPNTLEKALAEAQGVIIAKQGWNKDTSLEMDESFATEFPELERIKTDLSLHLKRSAGKYPHLYRPLETATIVSLSHRESPAIPRETYDTDGPVALWLALQGGADLTVNPGRFGEEEHKIKPGSLLMINGGSVIGNKPDYKIAPSQGNENAVLFGMKT